MGDGWGRDTPHMAAHDEFMTRLVGVSFCEGYPANLLRVAEMLARSERVTVELRRDASNPYDANTINVVCVAAGGRIGRVAKERAAYLADDIDRGEEWVGLLETVMVNPDHPDKPGAVIRCWRRDAVAPSE